MNVEFKFAPGQYVMVTLFDLRYPGRVTSCRVVLSGVLFYRVDYAVEGKIEEREFCGDELSCNH